MQLSNVKNVKTNKTIIFQDMFSKNCISIYFTTQSLHKYSFQNFNFREGFLDTRTCQFYAAHIYYEDEMTNMKLKQILIESGKGKI